HIAVLPGAGVEHGTAAALLKMLAERWSIPVATTLRAKGVFPEDHALSLGVFGYAGTRHATNAILDDALGCLLVLGSGLNERDTMHWTVRKRSKASMIHINIDMDELTANGDLGHVVPASTHAFLDLMDRRADLIGPPAAICIGSRHPGEDDEVAGGAGRSAGVGRRPMGQARTGRDRGAVGLLSDVRGDQSGVRYQARRLNCATQITVSSPRKRGPITTVLWNMGPRFRGDDSKRN